MEKYRLLRERVSQAELVPPPNLRVPRAATDAEIERTHDLDYLISVKEGTLTRQEIRRIGFPWSRGLVERSRRSVGATIEACQAALVDGIGVNLAGGTHHAHFDFGGGYCVFNDSMVAARVLQASGTVKRVLILDCDVHQGDGTAALAAHDPSICTFSIHGAKNYPFRKPPSDLDIPLEDGADDVAYLTALETGLSEAIPSAQPELVIYLAGADPYIDDKLGRLAVTKEGLRERDTLVFDACAGIPMAITMAGGYAKNVHDTVDIHFATVHAAASLQVR